MVKITCVHPIILVILSMVGMAMASDHAKEKRWADQLVDALMDGEAVWLKAGGHEFLGLYTEAEESAVKPGAIVLHGIGVHPDWPQVVSPLRIGLAERGWSTLSLQMPVLPNEAQMAEYQPLFEEVSPRIEAGVRFLKAQGITRIVIVAHSLGATMATDYLVHHQGPVEGFVGIGMSGGGGGRMDNVESLSSIKIPVLDLYGSDDLQAVLESSAKRAEAAKTGGNDRFIQIEIKGADHFFDGKEEALLQTVSGWLEKL